MFRHNGYAQHCTYLLSKFSACLRRVEEIVSGVKCSPNGKDSRLTCRRRRPFIQLGEI